MLTLQVTKWGGKRFEKVTNEMYDFLLMKMLHAATLYFRRHKYAISRHLKNRGNSYKMLPVVYSEENKEKRKEFALKYINELSMTESHGKFTKQLFLVIPCLMDYLNHYWNNLQSHSACQQVC